MLSKLLSNKRSATVPLSTQLLLMTSFTNSVYMEGVEAYVRFWQFFI